MYFFVFFNSHYWLDFLLQCVRVMPVSCIKPCWKQIWQQKLDLLLWMLLVSTAFISKIICLLLRETTSSWERCLTYTSHSCKLVSLKLCSAMCSLHSVHISTIFLLLSFKVSKSVFFILWIWHLLCLSAFSNFCIQTLFNFISMWFC